MLLLVSVSPRVAQEYSTEESSPGSSPEANRRPQDSAPVSDPTQSLSLTIVGQIAEAEDHSEASVPEGSQSKAAGSCQRGEPEGATGGTDELPVEILIELLGDAAMGQVNLACS